MTESATGKIILRGRKQHELEHMLVTNCINTSTYCHASHSLGFLLFEERWYGDSNLGVSLWAFPLFGHFSVFSGLPLNGGQYWSLYCDHQWREMYLGFEVYTEDNSLRAILQLLRYYRGFILCIPWVWSCFKHRLTKQRRRWKSNISTCVRYTENELLAYYHPKRDDCVLRWRMGKVLVTKHKQLFTSSRPNSSFLQKNPHHKSYFCGQKSCSPTVAGNNFECF